MPSGIIHHKYFKRGYVFVIPSSLILIVIDWQWGLGNLLGYSLGRWIDPDWDIQGVNNAEGRLVNELPIVGHYFFGLSSMYGSIFRRYHRSFITHFPGVSTIIRLFFVGLVPFLLCDNNSINLIGYGWHKFWLGIWIGLAQADFIHWYLDKTYGD